jgi:hypothetical protein
VELFGFPPNEGIPEWHREWRYQPPPNPNSPLYRARQGDEEALQEVLNYLLHPEGIRARVHLHPKLGWLQINLQAAEAPDPAWAKDFVRRVLTRLELTFCATAAAFWAKAELFLSKLEPGIRSQTARLLAGSPSQAFSLSFSSSRRCRWRAPSAFPRALD